MTVLGPPEVIEIEVKVEGPKIIDIGEYCVDCRDYVGREASLATRKPVTQPQGDGSFLKGFICEKCAPLEGTLIEATITALAERRWDERLVRERMKAVGPEELYEQLIGPMLDMMEMLLRLER